MRIISYSYRLYMVLGCTIIYTQESNLRPRAQFAQIKTELDDILSLLNVPSASQAQQAIKQLQTQVNAMTQKHVQLSEKFQKLSTDHQEQQKEINTYRTQLTQAQTQIEKLKKQLTSHRTTLQTLLNQIPDYANL